MFLRRSIAAGIVILALMVGACSSSSCSCRCVRHEYYAELSQGNRVRIEPLPPNRGLILTRNGEVLAENLPGLPARAHRASRSPMSRRCCKSLAALGLVDVRGYRATDAPDPLAPQFESVPIRLQMTDEEVARFAVRRHELPGVDIRTRLTRHYPFGAIAVHALGYVGAISEQDLKRIDAE